MYHVKSCSGTSKLIKYNITHPKLNTKINLCSTQYSYQELSDHFFCLSGIICSYFFFASGIACSVVVYMESLAHNVYIRNCPFIFSTLTVACYRILSCEPVHLPSVLLWLCKLSSVLLLLTDYIICKQ